MLGFLLSPVGGLLGSVADLVQDTVETVAPGSMNGTTLTGNLLADNGLLGDLVDNVGEGDVSGAVLDGYANVIGDGGVVDNLGNGGGLGVEGLLGGTLGLADGVLGTVDGLGGGLGDAGGLLG